MNNKKNFLVRVCVILLVGMLTSQSMFPSEIEQKIDLHIEWDAEGNPIAINGSYIPGIIYLSGSKLGLPGEGSIIRASYVDIPIDSHCEWKVSDDIALTGDTLHKQSDFLPNDIETDFLNYRQDLSPVIIEKGNFASFAPLLLEKYYKRNLEYVMRLLIPLDLYDIIEKERIPAVEYSFSITSDGFVEPAEDRYRGNFIDSITNYSEDTSIEVNGDTIHKIHHYYIITSKPFKEVCEKICVWQREKGYSTELIFIEDVLASSKFQVGSVYNGYELVDEAASLRAYIQSLYKSHLDGDLSIFFIGNEEAGIPVRKFQASFDSSVENGEFFGEHFIPSDGYYSDVLSDFILNKLSSGKYAVLAQPQYFSPIVPCGRLLTNSVVEVENYMRKLFIYEGNPGLGTPSYLSNALITAQNSNFKGKITDLSDYGVNTCFLQGTDYGDFNANTPTGSDVIAKLKNVGLVSMRGHGNPYTIACAGYEPWGGTWRYIQTEDILSAQTALHTTNSEYKKDPGNGLDLLENTGKPFVFYATGCTTTPFDIYYPGDGERFNRKYNVGSFLTTGSLFGAVAFIGSTRGIGHESAMDMENSFMQTLSRNKTLGEYLCDIGKKATFMEDQMMLNLIGDPTLHLWLGTPSRLESMISLQKNSLVIGSNNIASSKISLYDGIDPMEYKITDKSTNSFILNFTSTPFMGMTGNEGRDFLISIWQDGYLPDFFLVAENRKLKNLSKKYILRDLRMGNSAVSNECRYNVSDNGALLLQCSGLFVSDNGLNVGNNGVVEVVSEISATLSNDHIEDGGRLDVKSPVIILDSGFSVDKGGCLTLSPL